MKLFFATSAFVVTTSVYGMGSAPPGDATATDVSGVSSKTRGGSAQKACAEGSTCVVPAHHALGTCEADAAAVQHTRC